MAFFQNLFNKQQVPQIDFIQLDATGQIDPVESAKLNQTTQPRTLGERLFGKTYSTDVQEINPETNEVKLATTETFRPGFFNDLATGYKDNYDNGFNVNNLRNNNQNIATRLGEGLGTVGRFIDSPLGRGLIAGGLNKALGYDNSLQEGLQAFAGRQNAVTADKLYRKQLKDYGYTDEDLGQIRGNITSDVYKNLATNLYRTRKMDVDQYVKFANAQQQQLIAGIISPEQFMQNMKDLNSLWQNRGVETNVTGNVGLSNQTRNTNMNEQLLPYKQYALQMSPQIAMGNLGVAQGNLALSNERFNEQQAQNDFNNQLKLYELLQGGNNNPLNSLGAIKNQMDRFSSSFDNVPKDKMGAILSGVVTDAGFGNNAEVNFNSQKQLLFNKIARELGGEKGVLSDQDIKRIAEALPNLGDSYQQKQAKMKAVYDLLEDRINQYGGSYVPEYLPNVPIQMPPTSGYTPRTNNARTSNTSSKTKTTTSTKSAGKLIFE